MTKWLALVLVAAPMACGKPPVEEPLEIAPELLVHELDDVPSDLENRMLLDFGGKVHLVGYESSATDAVKRGERVSLKMYWRSIRSLTPGWSLFTHVLDDRGRRIQHADNDGPIRSLVKNADGSERQAFPPSAWKVGKVYVDEQNIEIPARAETETVAITVGVWRYAPHPNKTQGQKLADTRLEILGGVADSENRGIVLRLKTDYERPRRVAAGSASAAAPTEPPGGVAPAPQ